MLVVCVLNWLILRIILLNHKTSLCWLVLCMILTHVIICTISTFKCVWKLVWIVKLVLYFLLLIKWKLPVLCIVLIFKLYIILCVSVINLCIIVHWYMVLCRVLGTVVRFILLWLVLVWRVHALMENVWTYCFTWVVFTTYAIILSKDNWSLLVIRGSTHRFWWFHATIKGFRNLVKIELCILAHILLIIWIFITISHFWEMAPKRWILYICIVNSALWILVLICTLPVSLQVWRRCFNILVFWICMHWWWSSKLRSIHSIL